ncbi:hypothetical protein ABZ260_13710 [Streptosporangium sp. NPDC006013]|uniref:hypothetical protein n=1 Tax=Streptosporangium sp. NPDC006013 TaxID=3155596 RepID=UPI0033BB796D
MRGQRDVISHRTNAQAGKRVSGNAQVSEGCDSLTWIGQSDVLRDNTSTGAGHGDLEPQMLAITVFGGRHLLDVAKERWMLSSSRTRAQGGPFAHPSLYRRLVILVMSVLTPALIGPLTATSAHGAVACRMEYTLTRGNTGKPTSFSLNSRTYGVT